MSLVIHNAILMPGQTYNIFCTDGLSTNVVSHIKNLFNFGGNIVMKNCGAENELRLLGKAKDDMTDVYYKNTNNHDVHIAMWQNIAKYNEFMRTPTYRDWSNSYEGSAVLYNMINAGWSSPRYSSKCDWIIKSDNEYY